MRVALLSGCAQTVLDTKINEAAVRLLTRLGAEVVVAQGAGCCGALPHHLGRVDESHALARRNIEAWTREIETGGLDHIVIDTSGCGTTVKDYGHMFRDDATLAEKAARIAAMTRDITEIVAELGFAPTVDVGDAARRLSFGLLAAAWAEDHRAADGAAAPRRLRGRRRSRGAHLLRLGGNL